VLLSSKRRTFSIRNLCFSWEWL